MFSIIAGTIFGALSFLLLVPSSHSVQTLFGGIACIWLGSAVGFAASLFIGRSIKLIEREEARSRLEFFRDEKKKVRGMVARLHENYIVRVFDGQGNYDEKFIPVELTEIVADKVLEGTGFITRVVTDYDTSCWQYKWGRPSMPEGELVRYFLYLPDGTEPFDLRG